MWRRGRINSFLTVFLCAAARPSAAQLCAGAPSFEHYRWHTSVALELADGGTGRARSLGAAIGRGGERLFGSGQAQMVFDPDRQGRGYAVSGFGGAQFAAGSLRRLRWCPIVSATYATGPDSVGNVPADAFDASSASLTAGLLTGWVWKDGGTTQLVPTAGLGWQRDDLRATLGGSALPDVTDSFLVEQIGLGIILNDQMSLTPAIVMPMGSDRLTTSLRVLATLGFDPR